MPLVAQKTILLIEDSADDEQLTIRAITKSQLGVSAVVAHDGEEGLTLLGVESKEPCHNMPVAVLCDLKLPKVSGTEVVKRMRQNKRTENIPVIIFTSSSESNDVNACYENGASSFVKKPIGYQEYIDTVKAVIHYWTKDERNGERPFCIFENIEHKRFDG